MGEVFAANKPGIGDVLACESLAMSLVYALHAPEVKAKSLCGIFASQMRICC